VIEEPEALKTPPAPGLGTLATFPPVERHELSSGLSVSTLTQPSLPLTRIVVTFRSGRAQEGGKVGVSRLTARLLKLGGAGPFTGRQMVDRLESFGSSLDVATGSDHTSFSLSVLNADLAPALAALGLMLREARMPLVEFSRVKTEEIERAAARARGDFAWGNQLVLFHQLFEVATGVHPYASFDAKPSDVERLQLSDCTRWRLEHLTPDNGELIVVSSIARETVLDAAEKAFQKWQGASAPEPAAFDRPTGPARFSIFVVDHPDSPLSEVTAGVLGAPRTSAAWPALSLTSYILGSGPASRLFVELREQHSWALETSSDLVALRDAPAIIKLDATTLRAHSVDVVKSMIGQLNRLAHESPTEAEVEHAARSLTRSFLNDSNPMRSLAEMLARTRRLGLEPDDYDAFHRAVLELDASTLERVVQPYFGLDQAVVVVSADAQTVAPPLALLGPVVVLDPDKDFSIKQRLPYNPLAAP